MDRRGFLFGAGASLIAAPAIVRAASLMPVRGIIMPSEGLVMTSHGLAEGDYIFTGNLPFGIQAGRVYYVRRLSEITFSVMADHHHAATL